MIEPTEIEKKSLEAHVELCAERYNQVEMRLELLQVKINDNNNMIRDVRDLLTKSADKRNDQVIAWGLALLGAFVGSTLWLFTHYVLK